jgi:hypothetical protein
MIKSLASTVLYFAVGTAAVRYPVQPCRSLTSPNDVVQVAARQRQGPR